MHIWNVKEQSILQSFEGHAGKITSMSFSENGYYLATASEDATVRLWDLRKLSNFHTLEFDTGFDVQSVAFDHSGAYLAVGGNTGQVYNVKGWEKLKVRGGSVSCVRVCVCVCMDCVRYIRGRVAVRTRRLSLGSPLFGGVFRALCDSRRIWIFSCVRVCV